MIGVDEAPERVGGGVAVSRNLYNHAIMTVKAAVLGASGFSGGEVVRLLAGHEAVTVAALAGGRAAGRSLAEVHPHLAGLTDAPLVDNATALGCGAEVVFSCLPSGELGALGADETGALIVDLSDEHRADAGWVYGLTEFARDEVAGARRIANPGCYPTATLLALVPFAAAGAIDGPIVVDAISGVSGAGRAAADHLLLAVADGSVASYGTTAHRHIPEIEAALAVAGLDAVVSFTPHLAPMPRGLLVTARARPTADLSERGALDILRDAYAKETFVEVIDGWPATKAVAGSNRAQITARVDERAGWLVCSAAIDNLGKGAAGQAIQNANVALGLEESLGLTHRGVWP